MKKLSLSLLVIFIIINLFPRATFAVQWWYLSTFESWTGLYSSRLDQYYCVNEDACMHEQGHSKDRNLGWHSDTLEFQEAVSVLIECQTPHLSQLPYIQLTTRNADDLQEAYANLYSTVDLEGYDTLKGLINDYVSLC